MLGKRTFFKVRCIAGALCFGLTSLAQVASAIEAAQDGELRNLAIAGIATQSSTRTRGVAEAAIDFVTNGNYSEEIVTHTELQDRPWWQVDLREVKKVKQIVLWNRTDCCTSRLKNFRVMASKNPILNNGNGGDAEFIHLEPQPAGDKYVVNLDGDYRYIRVQLNGRDYLSLAEVQVFGDEVIAPIDVERGLDHRLAMFIHYDMTTAQTLDNSWWPDPTLDASVFAPEGLVDTDAWAEIARKTGMTQAFLTAKHHVGFANWPSKYADGYSIDQSGYIGGTDLVRQYVDSFRKKGVVPGFYFSVWDRRNPGNLITKNQLRELMVDYGHIPVLWIDGWGWTHGQRGHDVDYEYLPFNELRGFLRHLSPTTAIVNNDMNHNTITSDYVASEQTGSPATESRPKEAHYTMGPDTWHYRPGHGLPSRNWYGVDHFLGLINKATNNGRGTITLNVGPDINGVIPPKLVKTMEDLGDYLSQTNIALSPNVKVSQSSTHSRVLSDGTTQTFDASLAVNGMGEGTYEDLALTNQEYQPWFALELGESTAVNYIEVVGLMVGAPMTNYYLLTSNKPIPRDLTEALASADVSSRYINNGGSRSSRRIPINETLKYIRLQKSDTSKVLLSEIKVLVDAEPYAASQSSTYDGTTLAANGIDGNTEGRYALGELAHTNWDVNPWFMVDTKAIQRVDRVEVWPRTECCDERLEELYVAVSKQPLPQTIDSFDHIGAGDTATVGNLTVTHVAIEDTQATPISIDIPHLTWGRYVGIYSAKSGYLNLAEVRVLGDRVQKY
ncbi:MAG: alpha-L-fucosidase [Gammaproteobacteria bacterium]|nr:alpha-L-fucosidase [Gammaproteobacteria bacterium]